MKLSENVNCNELLENEKRIQEESEKFLTDSKNKIHRNFMPNLIFDIKSILVFSRWSMMNILLKINSEGFGETFFSQITFINNCIVEDNT